MSLQWTPVVTLPMGPTRKERYNRDANQYDFIIFSTIKRGKYDNTVLPLENTTFHQKPTNLSKTKQKNSPKLDRTRVMA